MWGLVATKLVAIDDDFDMGVSCTGSFIGFVGM
jgi:hypothetical protein